MIDAPGSQVYGPVGALQMTGSVYLESWPPGMDMALYC